MADVLNLIAKNATMKIGTYGQAEGAALDIGALEGGVGVEAPREYYEVKADAWQGVVGLKKIGEKMTIKCAMAEITLANLAIAFDYPATAITGGTLFKFGGDDTVTFRTIYINGAGPGGGTRKITLHKVASVGSAPHSYKKGEKTIVELELTVLEDTTKAAKERYGQIEDTPADTTPPTIALSTPLDGGTVAQGTKGVVVWDIAEANEMDESSIVYGNEGNATIMIINTTVPATAALVAGSIVYNATLKQITFTPDDSWTNLDEFQAIVTTGLKDAAGNHLAAVKIEQFSAA